jgi:hypothetical protein
MAIYYPSIETGIIGTSGVKILNDNYEASVKDICTNKYKVDSITIQSPSIEQLEQFIFFDNVGLNGNIKSDSKKPLIELYQKQSVLKNLKVSDWEMNGMSSIRYELLPYTTIKFVIYFNTSNSKEASFKKETKGKTTFEMDLDLLNMGDQCREPEEQKVKSMPIAMIEVSRLKSAQLEAGIEEIKTAQLQEYEIRQMALDSPVPKVDEPLCIETVPTIQDLMLAKANGIELKTPNCYQDATPIQMAVEKSKGAFANEAEPLRLQKSIPELMANLYNTPNGIVEGVQKNAGIFAQKVVPKEPELIKKHVVQHVSIRPLVIGSIVFVAGISIISTFSIK